MPGMLRLPEHAIRKKVRPSETTDRLRMAFWDEYNRAVHNRRRMNISNILRGVCSQGVWDRIYQTDRHKLLWIITPPKSYSLSMRQIAYRGLETLSQVMDRPIVGVEEHFSSDKRIGQILKYWKASPSSSRSMRCRIKMARVRG